MQYRTLYKIPGYKELLVCATPSTCRRRYLRRSADLYRSVHVWRLILVHDPRGLHTNALVRPRRAYELKVLKVTRRQKSTRISRMADGCDKLLNLGLSPNPK